MFGDGPRATTNDHGDDQIDNLSPGDWLVVVLAPTMGAPAEPAGGAAGFVPLFYPDTTVSAGAGILTLGAAEDRRGIDFHVPELTGYTVSGAIIGNAGRQQLHPTEVTLTPAEPAEIAIKLGIRTATADSQGRFVFPTVIPGRYVIAVFDVPTEAAPPGTSRLTYSVSGSGYLVVGTLATSDGSPAAISPPSTLPTLWARAPLVVSHGKCG